MVYHFRHREAQGDWSFREAIKNIGEYLFLFILENYDVQFCWLIDRLEDYTLNFSLIQWVPEHIY